MKRVCTVYKKETNSICGENREKMTKNFVFIKTKGEITNIKNNMLRIELKQMLFTV